jgi:hypothetical protein
LKEQKPAAPPANLKASLTAIAAALAAIPDSVGSKVKDVRGLIRRAGGPAYPALDGPHAAARLPAPLEISKDASDGEIASACAAAYRTAVEQVTGARSWAFGKGAATAKGRATTARLIEGGRALRDAGIPPLAWAAWSCLVWKRYSPSSKGGAPARWVFDPARVVERQGWFWAECPLAGGQVVWNDALRALIARWNALAAEVSRKCSGDADVEGAKAIVARLCPPEDWDALVWKSRQTAQGDQRRIDAAVARGEWVWQRIGGGK